MGWGPGKGAFFKTVSPGNPIRLKAHWYYQYKSTQVRSVFVGTGIVSVIFVVAGDTHGNRTAFSAEHNYSGTRLTSAACSDRLGQRSAQSYHDGRLITSPRTENRLTSA